MGLAFPVFRGKRTWFIEGRIKGASLYMQGNSLYPLFLSLEDRRVTVIGAGSVATRKVASLIPTGARIRVIAPEISPELGKLAEQGAIEVERRPYATGDLEGSILVIGATDDEAVNESVYREATERSGIVNVVDIPHLCNAYVPSVLQRGKLQIAVSTSGAAPHVARDIRRSLEEQFPAWWEDYLDTLAEVRMMIKGNVAGPASKRARLMEAVAPSVLAAIRSGEHPSAASIYQEQVIPALEALETEGGF